MALTTERLRSILESMLLVTSEPLAFARIVEVIQGEDPETPPEAIQGAIDELLALYGDSERTLARGFRVEEVGGGYQLRTPPENAQFVRRLFAARPQKLTHAALETLAIVAYRQPATKPEIEKVRGVDVGATLKALLERDLVRIIGKKEEVGRPILYGTTKKFLELFGLKSLAALPTLREYHELDEAHQKQVDELYEQEQRAPTISDLAAAAEFLVERQHDPDLDALDRAVVDVERLGEAAASAIGAPTHTTTTEGTEPRGDPPATPPNDAPKGDDPPGGADTRSTD